MPYRPKPSRECTTSVALSALGRAARHIRRTQDLSQEALGLQAQLHRNYVGAVERGTVCPTYRTLRRLADGLDVPLSELIRLSEDYERGVAPASFSPVRASHEEARVK